MSEEFKKIESLLEQIKDYANTRIAQAKLSIAENVSKVISNLVASLFAVLVFFFFLFFVSFAGAIALGQLFNNSWLGFLIVAGFYLLAGIIIWWLKEKLLRIPIMNSLIGKFFNNSAEDEKD
jgi:hypothetical protein